MQEAVLAGGREVVDEAGFLEVIEGWRRLDGFCRFEMERESGESCEASDDGGGAIGGRVQEIVDESGVQPNGGCALVDSVGIGACFGGEWGEFWVKIREEGELFTRVAQRLEEGDKGKVFGVHGERGWFIGCAQGGDAIAWQMLSGRRRISRCPVR